MADHIKLAKAALDASEEWFERGHPETTAHKMQAAQIHALLAIAEKLEQIYRTLHFTQR